MMDVEGRHILMYGPDNDATLLRLLTGMQGCRTERHEPQSQDEHTCQSPVTYPAETWLPAVIV
jgi:hypothetical protein